MKKTKGTISVVMSTVPDRRHALRLAKSLVEKKLAACCSISSGTLSFYWWKNKIEKAEEFILLMKTTHEQVKPLVKELKRAHPYEVPEVLVFSPSEGSKNYLHWIEDSTKKTGAKKKNVVSKL
ncbi:MAG: CutA1 divalent ion tolerance protein [Verrucomicrobiales bacterium]|nr:CutA1 divalent ion tolerance protein [Verrucomicrobiales bacterium]MDB6130897.1 CutA1 divalent ion tolerance protein [Verrucomicrobiales bacterium]